MRSVGLDLSARCSGLAIVDTTGVEDRGRTVELPEFRGFARLQLIAVNIQNLIEFWKPDVVIIEGYAKTPKQGLSSFVRLVEVGTVVRQYLFQEKILWYDVPPTTMKKWVTGNGLAKKTYVAEVAKQRWGYTSNSNDIIDALCLAKMGLLPEAELLSLKGVSQGFGK